MSKRAVAVLFACFCTVLAVYSIRYSYGTLLPEMLPVLGITNAEAGLIYSSYFIAYTVLSPVLGIISDRVDVRLLLAVFIALMGAGTFLMQYSNSLLQASLFFTLAGVGASAGWAPVMSLAQRWVSDKRRGMSLSLIDAGSSLGVMAAGLLAPLAVVYSGWQTGWMVLGIFGLALGLLNYLCIRNYPRNQAVRPAGRTAGWISSLGQTYKIILTDKRFWLIGLAYLLTGFAIIIPFTFLSTYAFKELSFSYDSATLLITIIGVGAITGKITLGPLSDKVGRIKIMLLCAALIGGGCLGIAYSRGWILMAICAVYGIGYGACWAMYAACAADFFSRQAAGGIIGLWTFLMGAGSIVAPIISGWSADVTGTLQWAFVIAGTAGVVSLVLLLPMLKVPRAETIKAP